MTQRILDNLATIIHAPNGIKYLREMILQLAVQGKLVPQDENDEPASVLLAKIQVEKERLIQEGKIKRQKPLPAITEEEKPFELPKGWEWVRLNDIGFDWGQVTPQSTFTYIDVASINNQKGFIQSPSVVEAENAPSRARKVVKKNTVIYSTIRPYLLNVCVVEKDYTPQAIASTAFAIIHPFKGILSSYIKAYLRSPAFIKYVEAIQVGVAYPAINDKQFFSGLFPIAPEKEQIRILAKVDSLLSLCDQLEALQTQCTQLNHSTRQAVLDQLSNAQSPLDLQTAWQRLQTHLPQLFTEPQHIKGLRDAILQLAVQGKLVPQDENDEPASVLLAKIQAEKERLIQEGKIKRQKPLPAITEEEKPFELPKGWEWVRFQEIGEIGRGKSKHRPRNDPSLYNNGTIPFIQTGDVARAKGYIKTNSAFYNQKGLEQSKLWLEGTLCITIAANIADTGVLSFDACFPDSVVGFIPTFSELNIFYYEYFLQTAKAHLNTYAPSTAQKNINLEILDKLLIPQPPVEELKKIVEKTNKLFSLCDQLESKLAKARQTQEQLALTTTTMS